MKNCLHKIILLTSLLLLTISFKTNAQTCEWRLANPIYNLADPDGAGPAQGSVTFTLQIHTTGAIINNVNTLATGWSYQSSSAMIPTSPGCGVVSSPANVIVSAPFTAGTFTYTTVNQCGVFSQTTGGQTFDRTVSGTLDGTGINLTSTWTDVFTATLWTLNTTAPEGGYIAINSSSLGSPGPLASYSVSDDLANEYPTNSLTYATPLPIGSGPLPVLFTKFDAGCSNNGAMVSWSTSQEFNSDYFEVQRSVNGNDWAPLVTIKAAGNSSTERTYQQLDPNGGTAYYRIKQVDIDKHAIYTSIIRTNCTRKVIDMVIYPVPARDILNVVISSDKSLKTKLLVVDGVGKIVRKMDVSLFNGSNTYLFNLNGLASGQYFIRSIDAATGLNKKFNIVR